jgi:hypothetical protein
VSGNGIGVSLGRLIGLLVVMLGAPNGLWVSPPDIDVGLTLGELVGLLVVVLVAPDELWVSAPGIDVGLTLGELLDIPLLSKRRVDCGSVSRSFLIQSHCPLISSWTISASSS